MRHCCNGFLDPKQGACKPEQPPHSSVTNKENHRKRAPIALPDPALAWSAQAPWFRAAEEKLPAVFDTIKRIYPITQLTKFTLTEKKVILQQVFAI